MSTNIMNVKESPYRWYVLALAALTHTLVSGMPLMCMPVLFKEISQDLGLSLIQIGTVWGFGSMSGVFTGLVGGSLGDRFGTNRILSIACLSIGLSGALRGISNDFITLAVTAFLFGFLLPAIPPNVHKVCGIWFSGKRLGFANGVASAGMALGFMVGSMISATVLSPLLGGWRNVLFFFGAISMCMSIPWLLIRKGPGPVKSVEDTAAPSLRMAFSHVVHLKSIFFFGLIMLGLGSCLQGMLGYLPLYLRDIGWSAAGADGALATFHGISMIFTIPMALLSDRIGSRKKVLLVATVMTIGGVGLLSVAEGALVWVAVIISGIIRDGFMAIFMTMVMETKGVGRVYSGTAMGMIMVYYRIGGLVSPPLGNSLAHIDVGFPFLFWALVGILALVGFYFIKEEDREAF
ncbi:MAG: MFS transporter [Theionarchaea archaeon]|nr:MFS transporter [Theionarchaea archaeon]